MITSEEPMQRGSVSPIANADGALGKIAKQQVAAATQAQGEILDEYQQSFNRWCGRRRHTAEAFATFSSDALQAKSPQDFFQVWMQWSKGAFERLTEDAKDQMEIGSAVARNCAKGPVSGLLNLNAVSTATMPTTKRPKIETNGAAVAERH